MLVRAPSTLNLLPLRYLWALPTTAPGLLLAVLARTTGGRWTVVDGVLEAHGGAVGWLLRRVPVEGGAGAMTLGHVVVARDARALEASRMHERVHVRQAERWGVLFYPAYAAASGWAWLRGGDVYLDNRFEREAYAEADFVVREPLAGWRWQRRRDRMA